MSDKIIGMTKEEVLQAMKELDERKYQKMFNDLSSDMIKVTLTKYTRLHHFLQCLEPSLLIILKRFAIHIRFGTCWNEQQKGRERC